MVNVTPGAVRWRQFFACGSRGLGGNCGIFEPNSHLQRQTHEPKLNATPATSDEVLIGRIANGDRLAMQVLFARHHVRVYRFVLRLVRNESTAEDLISEVFLDVWRQAGKFEGRAAVSTWLLAIARFKALSALRRKPEQELDEETAEAIEDTSDNPEVAAGEEGEGRASAQVHDCTFTGASGDHRPRLLPREIGGRGGRDRRHPRSDGENPHVLCA